MKANGLMAIAFLCSGTAFAQQASVKTTVNAHVNSQTSAGNTSVGSTAASSSTVMVAPGATGSAATAGNAARVSQTSVENAGNMAVRQTATGTMVIENTMGNALETAGGASLQLRNSVNNITTPSTGINTTVSHRLNVHSAPLRMNTRITGGAIPGIL